MTTLLHWRLAMGAAATDQDRYGKRTQDVCVFRHVVSGLHDAAAPVWSVSGAPSRSRSSLLPTLRSMTAANTAAAKATAVQRSAVTSNAWANASRPNWRSAAAVSGGKA